MDLRESARQLRQRLNDHSVDVVGLAADAVRVFAAAGSEPHVRWLEFERNGYGSIGSTGPLDQALGVPATDRLVVHVLAYRAQSGQVVDDSEWAGHPFRHFFVESLQEVATSAARVRVGSSEGLRLAFGPQAVPNYPIAAIFPRDVFERILLGFRATLHLQLGTIEA